MIYIGTSGYVYQDWRGRFYPEDLPQERWLEYYAEHFTSVEINLTFYRLPASPVFRHWRTRTPKDFRFVLKGSRLITHAKRLRDCHHPLAEFYERASELGEKLSCILWQLPPKFPHDVELLEDFLAESERAQLVYGKVCQTFEFRDLSWFEEPVYEVLKQANVAIAIADWPFKLRIQKPEFRSQKNKTSGDTSEVEETRRMAGWDLLGGGKVVRPDIAVPLTADFLYLRRHGPATRYASPYNNEEIKQLATDLQPHLKTCRDIYVFFNNNAQAYAVENARQLSMYL